ncbi:MAG: CHAD domain-containing protein [Anaerolineaceae bacterium]|nr:CHAD domain-containing protein [Anaerolineaceae bacterium]
MSPKPDDGMCVFGAVLLHRYLDALIQEVDGVRIGEDIEFIHRMRVASRRLRAALPLFSDCLPPKKYPTWEKSIREITKALGAARDLDVQLDVLQDFSAQAQDPHWRPGLYRLMLRLRQQRVKKQVKVDRALNDMLASGTISNLGQRLSHYEERQNQTYLYTPALYRLGYDAITRHLEDFLGYDEIVEKPEEVEQLHAMRIAAKRLRYTLEIFAPLYPGELKDPIQAGRKAQDLLGEIHDCDVWTGFLPLFLERERRRILDFYGSMRGYSRITPGIQAFLADRQGQREQKYLDFVHFWSQHKTKNTWGDITKVIQAPSYRSESPAAPLSVSLPDEEGNQV